MFKIYSLLPRLTSHGGHGYPYHVAVQEGFKQIGWDYFCFYPKKAAITPPNKNWQACLANDLSENPKGILSKILIFFANIIPFKTIFQKSNQEPYSVIFIEQFEFTHLASILVALFLLKPRFHFWILHRYVLEENSRKATLYRWMHSVIEQRIAPGKFKCFTDSDLIQLKNSQVLRRVFDVVPIPHTSYKPSKERKGQDLFVWVPGDPVRSDKGFHVIQDFLKKIEDFPQIKLILSEKTRTLFKENKQLIFLPDYLSMEAYEKQMSAVDFIFLPYDSFEYKFRTSGIFVEAICSGAIPLVSKGTWMAHELEKFSLEDLTFTWKEVNLVEKLLSFLSNERKNFLSVMKKEYQRYHCRKNMAQTLQNFTR